MLIVACCLAPLCMFGSPADFWFVAVGALVSTVAGCIIVLVKVYLDPLFNLMTVDTFLGRAGCFRQGKLLL